MGSGTMREEELRRLRRWLEWRSREARIPGCDVEELVQETLLAVTVEMQRRGVASLWGFSRLVLRRRIDDYWRRRLARNKVIQHRGDDDLQKFPGASNPRKELLQEERQERFRRALAALPRRQRQVIMLSLQGYPRAEMAELLGIARNSVRNHKHEGMKALRAALEQADEDDEA